MSCKLHNSLLEMLAVIGLDGNTALVPADSEVYLDQLQDVATIPLSPQILAAISGNAALFPHVSQRPDRTYPPQLSRSTSVAESSPKKLTGGHRSLTGMLSFSQGSKDSIANLKRQFTKRHPRRQVDFSTSKKLNVREAQLPLNAETLTALTALCFPDNCFICFNKPSDTLQYLVLTDIVGTRTYAASLCCYTRHCIFKDSDDSWRCTTSPIQDDCKDQETQFAYVPQCYVFISRSPLFTVMKDCLSRLVQRVNESKDDWRHLIKECAMQLAMTSTPPAGSVFMQLQLFDILLTIPSADGHGRLPIDYDLGVVFRCLDSQSVLLVMTAILMQQRLLFMSSSYVLLTLVMESFIHFLFPFQWNFTYVPLLPLSLLELVEAPGTFMMGCHSRHRHIVENVDGLVVVNLDNGTALPSPPIKIPALPKDPVKIFKEAIRRTITPVEVWRLESKTAFTYEEMRHTELKEQLETNSKISTIFLELMVNLFRNVLLHISPEKRFFHREQFLEAVGENDRPFYSQVLNTDLFTNFLRERLDKKQDLWTEYILQNRPVARSSTIGATESLNERRLSQSGVFRNSNSLPNLPTDFEPDKILLKLTSWTNLKLPDFSYSFCHQYLERCYQEVSSAVTNCHPLSNELSSYLYLRGMLSAACNKKMASLEDFCALATVNHHLFPIEFVLQILSSMSEDERTKFESSTLYKSSSILREILALKSNQLHEQDQPVVMELNKIPKRDIDLQWFIELMAMLNINSDSASAQRLFDALTLGQSDVVDPLTFEEFYKCWKENELEIHRPILEIHSSDHIVKISDLTKCCFGMGHILLTQNRILYMEEGLSKVRLIANLVDIKRIDKLQQRSFFKEQWIVKIYYYSDKREKAFVAYFQDDSHKWHLLLNEMWSGKLIAEKLKDLSVLHQAMQNVLIVDAYLCSGEIEWTTHYKEALQMSPSLCYFMSKNASQQKGTNELLVKRLDPNAYETKRSAIETVLYTSSYEGKGDPSTKVTSRIWCGMANGKVQVFDCDLKQPKHHHLFLAKSAITCLLQCQHHEIWASSFDRGIYLIQNLHAITCGRILYGHTDKVTDLTLSGDHKYVYSAGINGKVIIWNAETKVNINELDVTNKVIHKILCHGDRLFCCTQDELLILSLDGAMFGKISFNDPTSVSLSSLECFVVTSQNEIWIGLGQRGEVRVCDLNSLCLKATLDIPCSGIGVIVCVQNKVWVGSKHGSIHIFNRDTYILNHQLTAHSDAIISASVGFHQEVVTGSGGTDGWVGIWRCPVNL